MIKKIILTFTFIFSIFFISNVYAYNSNVFDNLYLNSNANYLYFGWTSENNYSSSQQMAWFSESQNLNEPYQRAYKYITPGSGHLNDANGFSIVFPNEQQFIANNNYNGSFVICSYGGSLPLTDLNISVGDRVAIIEPSYYSTIYKFDTIDTGLVDDGQGGYFDQCKIVSFSFKAKNSGNYFAFRYRTNKNTSMGNYIAFLGSNFDYNGTDYSSYFNSLNGSIDSLNASLNNNTQNVINNDNQNTQNVINNDNQNTQNVINNNNQNTQNLIDNQNDLTKGNCTIEESKNKLQLNNGHSQDSGYNIDINNGIISIYGTPTNSNINNEFYIPLTKSFVVNNGENYVFTANNIGTNWFGSIQLCDSSNNCRGNIMLRYENNQSANIGSGTYSKIKISIRGNIAVNSKLQIRPQLEYGQTKTDFTPYEEKEVCTGGTWGKLDEGEKTRKGIFAKIGELFSFFNKSDDIDTTGLNNSAGWLPPGPVDSILLLPINLLNQMTSNLSTNCTPLNITLPFVNQNISLPCMTTIYSEIGATAFVNIVGIIASVGILIKYFINLYKYVDNTLTLRENTQLDNWGGV